MRIWLFRCIAISIPFIFFGLLEFGLRLGGFGADVPLFIENPANSKYLLPRPDVLRRYFRDAGQMPGVTLEANFLLKQKPENGLRIFVQGGSSAAGFPYGLGASLAGNLDLRLKQTFPDKHVEVINTAMAAVNSYTLLDLSDEIIEQQPDAVLIYAGHNEYLGILGVGSNYTAASSHATTLLFLKIKSWRIFQLIQNQYQKISGNNKSTVSDFSESRTFMSKVAKQKDIKSGGEIYQAGLAQFESNLALLIDKYQQAGIPVFIATLASNIADQTPFSSVTVPKKLITELAILEQVSTQIATSPPKVNQLQTLSQQAQDSKNAELHFRLGKLFLRSGMSQKAHFHFTQAKDNDLLRFRAPEAFNQIIRNLALRDKVYLVDVQKRLSVSSATGIIGNNLMLEHLHMNVQGYFLMSDAFYETLKKANHFGQWQHVDIKDAWQGRPLLPSEEYNGFAKVQQLMSDYPFTLSPQTIKLPRPTDWQQQLGRQMFEKKVDWLSMAQRALRQYQNQKNAPMILKTMRLIADALPHDPDANLAVAEALSKDQQFALSSHYYIRTFNAGDSSGKTIQLIINALTHANQPDRAEKWQTILAGQEPST